MKPYIPELKIKDYKTYHAFRCGLCSRLFSDYGPLARTIVSGDSILFALLCDSLAGREGTCKKKRCPYNSFHRCTILSQTQGIRLAAKMQVILTWHKLIDMSTRTQNIFVKTKYELIKVFLRTGYKKALSEEGSRIERLIQQERDHAYAIAMTGCTNYEVASQPFANMFSGLFLHCASDDASWKSLQMFGQQLGRLCYFIRSVKWYDSDKELGTYNVFIQNGLTKQAAIESAKHQCNVAAVDLAKASALLNMQMNRSLLDNIIYLGLEHAVEELGQTSSATIWAFK
ncbi:MAG: DUF5685 family protein [Faecalibacterium sp.]